jgi:hypothetical protein
MMNEQDSDWEKWKKSFNFLIETSEKHLDLGYVMFLSNFTLHFYY